MLLRLGGSEEVSPKRWHVKKDLQASRVGRGQTALLGAASSFLLVSDISALYNILIKGICCLKKQNIFKHIP